MYFCSEAPNLVAIYHASIIDGGPEAAKQFHGRVVMG
jgi:hypothetical protein